MALSIDGLVELCKEQPFDIEKIQCFSMCGNYTPQIFKEFERFDYELIYAKDDFELRIIEKETSILVATV